jgi:hypothetical protein
MRAGQRAEPQLREHAADLPFVVIADPGKVLYHRYGDRVRAAPAGGRLGLPGDFLIAPDGRIVASKVRQARR